MPDLEPEQAFYLYVDPNPGTKTLKFYLDTVNLHLFVRAKNCDFIKTMTEFASNENGWEHTCVQNNLEEARTQIDAIAWYINDQIKEHEHSLMMIYIQKSLQGRTVVIM